MSQISKSFSICNYQLLDALWTFPELDYITIPIGYATSEGSSHIESYLSCQVPLEVSCKILD